MSSRHLLLCCLCTILGVTVVQCSDLSGCGAGWFEVNDKCYVVIPIPQNFMAAIALCESDSFGGKLVQLETKTEKDAFMGVIRKTYELIFTGQLFWIGAKGGKHVFLWNSGLPVTYYDFVPGTDENVGCLAFGTSTLENYTVLPCTNNNLVICEKSSNTTSVGTGTGTVPQVGR